MCVDHEHVAQYRSVIISCAFECVLHWTQEGSIPSGGSFQTVEEISAELDLGASTSWRRVYPIVARSWQVPVDPGSRW
jgi:hypothetical protein